MFIICYVLRLLTSYCIASIQLAGEDVKDVNFVVLYESSNIFITGNVVTEEWLLKSLKVKVQL